MINDGDLHRKTPIKAIDPKIGAMKGHSLA